MQSMWVKRVSAVADIAAEVVQRVASAEANWAVGRREWAWKVATIEVQERLLLLLGTNHSCSHQPQHY